MLTGLYRATAGTILFDGHDVTDKPPHAITKLGVGRTFQNIRLFPQMTALENVLVGMHSRLKGGILGSIFGTPGVRREEREAGDRARELLRYVGLTTSEDGLAESLRTAIRGASRSPGRSRPSRSSSSSTSRRPA